MQLKQVYNNYIPFKGYIALTIYPWVFIRKDLKKKYIKKVERHETTHALQQLETLWVGFFILYILEYLIKFILCKFNHKKAYYSISFEQESFMHELQIKYNSNRPKYEWCKYLLKIKEDI